MLHAADYRSGRDSICNGYSISVFCPIFSFVIYFPNYTNNEQ